MTKSGLEKWRFFVPFLIVSAAATPIILFLVKDENQAARIVQYGIIPASWVLAGLYSAMKLRNYCWYPELERYVGKQIRTELIKLAPGDLGITDAEKERLWEKEIWRKLTGVFWEAIDSDPELRQQKEHFYANGVFYTSAFDLYLLLPVMSLLYCGVGIFLDHVWFLVLAAVYVALALVGRYLIVPRTRKHHMELSSEQLDMLRRRKGKFVSNRFREIIQEWRLKQEE